MKKTSKQQAPQKLRKRELAERILLFLQKENKQAFNHKQIAFAIDATHPANRNDIINILDELVADDMLIEVSMGKYKSISNRGTEGEGIFIRRSSGKNAVLVDDEQIFVAERNSMHALNGDKVRVIISAQRKGCEPEAKVIEIIEAKEQVFVGTLRVEKNYSILITDSRFLAADIIIPRSKLRGGKTGDKAVVRITKWNDDEMNPRGEVVDILGLNGENDAEMHAILAEYGLPYKYPENIEKAAEKIDAGITDEEIARREDFRNIPTFTIDPKDAKDFDDALSIRRLNNGNWEIGVHIADVTHYVLPNTNIDKEAFNRATSIYLVDRTIPMLPEHLSNGICSLRPNEEKLTFSVIVEMTDNAKIINSRIAKTVICSCRRFSYEEAQTIIETKEGELKEQLLTLDKLAKQLRQYRYDNGAIDFDRVEVRFDIDEKGKPVSIYFKESKDAHKLIEEFMLLANRIVAEFVGRTEGNKKAKTFVYRVHDNPDPEKISNLSIISSRFGHKVKTDGRRKEINNSLNKLLCDIKGKGEENLITLLTLRSMAKAVYTTENIGHYGLAADFYTHFTSPIRRYPDMMVHRLLARYMNGGKSVDKIKTENQCKHSSDMEQLAANAERASIKYKQVEFMTDHLGEIYTGMISGVTEWGIYVELDENRCEGLVPIRDLEEDYYDYDEKNYTLTGRLTGRKYQLGDKVSVLIARADLERKVLDFSLVSSNGKPIKTKVQPLKESVHSVKQEKSKKQRSKNKGKKERRAAKSRKK